MNDLVPGVNIAETCISTEIVMRNEVKGDKNLEPKRKSIDLNA